MNKNETQAPSEAVEPKKPFCEPDISDPVDVVKGNPAAGALFAVASSGIPAP